VKCTIKKTFLLIFLVFLVSSFGESKSVRVTLDGIYLAVADDDYKALYGKQKYFPEGKLSIRLKGNIFLWGSFGYLPSNFKWKEWSNKSVPLADLDGKSVNNKSVMSLGLGYYVGYIAPGQFSVKVELGGCRVTDTITETKTFQQSSQMLSEVKTKRSGLGFRASLGVTYGFYKSFYTEASLGYLFATDKVDDTRIKLGGLRAAWGIGISF